MFWLSPNIFSRQGGPWISLATCLQLVHATVIHVPMDAHHARRELPVRYSTFNVEGSREPSLASRSPEVTMSYPTAAAVRDLFQ
jgi:hypothetical protein